ncbi:MAG: hypothetical protein K0B15_11430 [Lentimicrobium sp.]|nr:hypothetical protein [Lentimicrobium sp.]
MKKKLYLPVIVLLAVIALIFVLRSAYSYYNFLKQPVLPITHAIPEQSIIVLKSGSVTEFIGKSRASGFGDVLQAIGGRYAYYDLASVVDSLSQHDVLFQDIFDNNEFVISVLPDLEGDPEILFTIKTRLKNIRSLQKSIISALKDKNIYTSVVEKNFSGIYQLTRDQDTVWYYLDKGIFTLGFNPETVNQSLMAIEDKKSLAENKTFARLNAFSGKKVDAVLFIRNDQLYANALRRRSGKELVLSNFFHSWSALDLSISKEKVLLSGFTQADKENWLVNQSPANNDFIGKISSGFSAVYSMSINDMDQFLIDKKIGDTLKLVSKDKRSQFSSVNVFRINENLKSWIGNEICIVTDVKHGDKKDPLVLIESTNPDIVRESLRPFINSSANPLPKIKIRGIFDRLFGEMFAFNDSAYCLIAPDYFAFSSSYQVLAQYSAQTRSGSGISNTQIPLDYLNDKSNLLVYFSAGDMDAKLKSGMVKDSEKGLKSWTGFLDACRHITLQYSGGDSLIYTQGSILFNPSTLAQVNLPVDKSASDESTAIITPDSEPEEKETEIEEKTETRQDVKVIPAVTTNRPLVLSGQKGGQNVIAIAYNDKLVLFNDDGKIAWQFGTKGKPNGDVFEIVNPENGKRNYVIITDSHIHLIGIDGKEEKKSPVKLPEGIQGKASLFDYDKKRDYRLVYPGKDGKIYNITISGKELPDWSKPKVNFPVDKPLFIRTSGKDYLMFLYGGGELKITDRRGKVRIPLADNFKKSSNADVFENKTNNKGLFLTASKDGKLQYINADGKISTSDFGDFGSDPWFVYTDFDNDNSLDFIFAGKGKIGIYSRLKKELSAYSQKNAEFGKPFVYKTSGGATWIAFREINSGDIILFKSKNDKPMVLKIKSDADPVFFNPGGQKPEQLVTIKNGKPFFTSIK